MRNDDWLWPRDMVFQENIDHIFDICSQLCDKELIEWKPVKFHGSICNGSGKITSYGIDVIEGKVSSPLESGENVTASPQSQNILNLDKNINKIMLSIEQTNASKYEKEEVKLLVQKLFKYSWVDTIFQDVFSSPNKIISE